MPPRSRTTAPPLDIDDARRRLADGKIVRVGIGRSAHFPEGGTGRIRFIGDPETDGEEFVQVEVLVNGTKDVLPFTPADLSPVRRSTGRGATPNGAVARGASSRASRARRATGPTRGPGDDICRLGARRQWRGVGAGHDRRGAVGVGHHRRAVGARPDGRAAGTTVAAGRRA